MTSDDEIRFHLGKLTGSLKSLIGKTISDVVIITNPPRPAHLFLVFSDGTHYEFYDLESLNGARWTDPGGVDRITPRVSVNGKCLVVSAD